MAQLLNMLQYMLKTAHFLKISKCEIMIKDKHLNR